MGCVFRLWVCQSVVISGCHYNTFVLALVNTCPIGETFTYHSAPQHNLPKLSTKYHNNSGLGPAIRQRKTVNISGTGWGSGG